MNAPLQRNTTDSSMSTTVCWPRHGCSWARSSNGAWDQPRSFNEKRNPLLTSTHSSRSRRWCCGSFHFSLWVHQ